MSFVAGNFFVVCHFFVHGRSLLVIINTPSWCEGAILVQMIYTKHALFNGEGDDGNQQIGDNSWA
ncbi:hypothetical protein L336_0583 [Candidatus Saccharimonas aalborgensis]|uniref:Uncharacterized protein n=1 Tax=Candidatus Saccharimonas aalborgensis TaxID=1332188 RepID=R4PYJ4_9BACT|nr:hypothetical protein L336_0583 [Candidatus Saccharimonas aalborgensis]